MALQSPRTTGRRYNTVPLEHDDERDHRYLLARAIQYLNEQLRPGGVRAVTAATTELMTDRLVLGDATGGAFTVTLLTAAGREGHEITVKKTDVSGNAVTIDGAGSETIDGATTVALSAQYSSRRLVSDGTNWHVIASI